MFSNLLSPLSFFPLYILPFLHFPFSRFFYYSPSFTSLFFSLSLYCSLFPRILPDVANRRVKEYSRQKRTINPLPVNLNFQKTRHKRRDCKQADRSFNLTLSNPLTAITFAEFRELTTEWLSNIFI